MHKAPNVILGTTCPSTLPGIATEAFKHLSVALVASNTPRPKHYYINEPA